MSCVALLIATLAFKVVTFNMLASIIKNITDLIMILCAGLYRISFGKQLGRDEI